MSIINYISLFCIFATQTVYSQTTITLSAPPTPAQQTSIARDAVIMNQVFSFTASAGNSFRAAIDKTVVGDQIPNSSTTVVDNDEQGLSNRVLDKSLQVGSVAGGLNVGADGSATYQVPIAVPQGIMGMEPAISLVYNSQGGDGIMGMGWNLSCVSAINRTGYNLYHDNITSNLMLTADDPLSMDGMRLICKDAGSKGLSGANFVCEVANNYIITKQSNGFIVNTPDGRTLEYGISADKSTQFEVTGGTSGTQTVSWMLEKVTDANGNYMTYSYQKNTTNGELYISSINYTGNTSRSPFNRVQFLYFKRDDFWTGSLLDNKISRNVLLEKIELLTDNRLVGSYDIKYTQENGISQLTEVTQTNRDGQSLNPKLFKWTKPQYSGVQSNTIAIPGYQAQNNPTYQVGDQVLNGDFNGDGYQDVVLYRKTWVSANAGLARNDNSDNHIYTHKLILKKGLINGLEDTNIEIELPRSKLFNHYLDNVSNTLTYDLTTSCHENFNSDDLEIYIDPLKKYLNDIFLVTSGDYDGDGKKEVCVGIKNLSISKNCRTLYMYKSIIDCYTILTNCGTWDPEYEVNTYSYYFYKVGSNGNLSLIKQDTDDEGDIIPSIISPVKIQDANIDINQDGKTDCIDQSDSYPSFYSINLTSSSLELLKTLPFNVHNLTPIDFNGDGLIDYAKIGDSKIYLKDIYNNFSIVDFNEYEYNATSIEEGEPIMYIDINRRGEGYKTCSIITPISEWNWWNYYQGSCYENLPVEKPFYQCKSYTLTFNEKQTPMIVNFTDINNDGKNEIINMLFNQSTSSSASINSSVVNQISYAYALDLDCRIHYTYRDELQWFVVNALYKNKDIYLNKSYSLKFFRENNYKYQNLIPSIETYNFDTEIPKFISLDVNGDGWEDLLKITGANLKEIKINNKKDSYSIQNVNIYVGNSPFVEDYNADGNKELISIEGGTIQQTIFNTGISGYHISEVIDGMNNSTKITYKPLTDTSAFPEDSPLSLNYPMSSIITPQYVVSEVKSSTGLKDISNNEIWNTVIYQYKNPLIHLQGRGFLGFEKFISISTANNQMLTQTFEVDTVFYNLMLKKTEVQSASGTTPIASTEYTNTIESHATNSLLIGKQFRPLVSQTVQTDNQKGVTVSSTFDPPNALGNPTKSTVQYGDEVKIETNIVYDPSYPFKPSSITTKKTYLISDPNNPFEQQQTFTYTSDGKGNLETKTDFANTNKPSTTTFADFNTFGQAQTIVKSATGETSITNRVTYDTKGRVDTRTNELEQTSTITYNPTTGYIDKQTDYLNKPTTYTYTSWGQPLTTTSSSGATATVTTSWVSDADPNKPTESLAIYKTTKSASVETASVITYYDRQGRDLRSVTKDFLNRAVIVDKAYNSMGIVAGISDSYFSGTPSWTNFIYDDFGRQTEINSPTVIATIEYSGLSVETTVNTRKEKKTYNAMGDVVLAERNISTPLYTSVSTVYASSGQPKEITAAGITTSMEYNDPRGLQTKLIDADAGVINYTYDGFGRIETQTDARGNKYTMDYDDYGRLASKICTTGDNYTYIYYPETGFLWKEIGNSNSKEYTYDDYGRILSQKDIVNGTDNYTTSCQYDMYNRLTQKTYPSGYLIKYSYNTITGELTGIYKENGDKIWELSDKNSKGQVTKYTQGEELFNTNIYSENGFLQRQKTGTAEELGNIQNLFYNFDETHGNLTNRRDDLTYQSETFIYDAMDRLTTIIPDHEDIVISYANNGNILSKSDAGNYQYDATPPHAIKGVTGNTTIPALQQDIVYNAFGKIAFINEGTNSLNISYGVDQQRIEGKWYNNGTLVKTKKYLGDYETITSGSNTKQIHYIFAPTGLVAVMVRQGTTDALYYTCTDHLGSLTVMSNEAGQVTERYSYDAWGRQRSLTNWETYTNNSGILERSYEYTGHETLADFGLINMNGRVYDPILGRMLSPDNYVQDPFNSQSFNRYSYCINNPLLYIDPTGDTWFSDIYNWAKRNTWDVFWNALNGHGGVSDHFRQWGVPYFNVNYNSDMYGGGFNGGVSVGNGKTSVSLNYGTGSHGYNFGLNLNYQGSNNGFEYYASGGVGYNSGMNSLGTDPGGSFYWNVGGIVSYDGFGGGYSYNSFGGRSGQGVGTIHLKGFGVDIKLSNDLFALAGKDRYRSGGLVVTYKVNENLSLVYGASMITGQANKKYRHQYGNQLIASDGKRFGTYDSSYEIMPDLRGGTSFGGVISNGIAYFAGSNSENRLHEIQNYIHREIVPTAYFQDRGLGSQGYYYVGGYHPFYLFY